jgi:arylsulfatase A-like enzyme
MGRVAQGNRWARAGMAGLLLALAVALPAAAQDAPRVPLAPPFAHDAGHAYWAAAPEAWRADGPGSSTSRLQLYEDGRPLGPAHALHEDVRARGGGAFSHWAGRLLFSSGDGSDPNANGRRYEVAWLGPTGLGEDGWVPLPAFDPFAGVPIEPAAAEPGAAARLPGTIWIFVIDALRADALDALDGGGPLLATLAGFARQAVRFTGAHAASSFTRTSTATLFTGLWPARHGVLHGVVPVHPDGAALAFDLDRRWVTLAEWAAAQGWETWTHPYSVHVRPGDGLLQGFARTDLRAGEDEPFPEPPAPERRLLVYEHILGAHGPYRPSAAARARLGLAEPALLDPASTEWFEGPLDPRQVAELRGAYLAEAVDADGVLARRLAWLSRAGRLEDALVIVTADHGEAFLEHGALQHATSLHEEVLRVPLLVHFPAGSSWAAQHGRTLDARVSLADLYPTLLELAGARGPAYDLDGRSLLPLLDGRETGAAARPLHARASFLAAHEGGSRLFVMDAVLDGPLKAILGWRCADSQDAARPFARGDWAAELYDLAADPDERHDLARARPADFLLLQQRARAVAAPPAARGAPLNPAPPSGPMDEHLLETLRQLGYVR